MMPYSKLEEKFISKLWLNSLEFKIHLALHVSSLLLPIANLISSFQFWWSIVWDKTASMRPIYYSISIVDTPAEYQNIGL